MGRSEEGPIGIAGAGRLGQALGRLLRERGEPVVAIASRDLAHARAGAAFIVGVEAVSYTELPARASRILICVADDAITPVAHILADAGMRAGVLPSPAPSPARDTTACLPGAWATASRHSRGLCAW